MASSALAVANLIAQSLPSLVALYHEIAQQNAGQLPTKEQMLAKADADWQLVGQHAQQAIADAQGDTGSAQPAS